jgi:glycosyltransferase involved in cell wall biosynthesis|tara:strand:+ start:7193 stop:8074 length:882 start_codon:yes stop_codon:yes gene_type:complete
MNNNNLVSVLVPVYNSEKYLEECLNSILSQTYENLEILAVDDGSDDSSLDILKNYSDKIKIFTQKNQGLATSLNLGIGKSQGKWLKWFSPDDIMYSNTIENLVNEAVNQVPNTIHYSNWNIIDQTGKILREFNESNYNEISDFDFNVRLLDGQQINVNTTLIPSELFNKCRFRDLEDPTAIDYDFFINCALLHEVKFHLISKPLIKYRIHSNQFSHKNISKTLEFIQEIKNDLLEKIDDTQRQKYISELNQYQKSKPRKRKTMEFGAKLLSSTPTWASDRVLTFYLNKIRRSR